MSERNGVVSFEQLMDEIDSEKVLSTDARMLFAVTWVAASRFEREECAKLLDEKALSLEAKTDEAEADEVSALRSTAWQMTVVAEKMRKRGSEGDGRPE